MNHKVITMPNKTLKNISIGTLVLSIISVILNVYFKSTTWYKNNYTCSGACGAFSTLTIVLTIGGFIMGIIFLNITKKNPDIEGKSIIRIAMLLNIVLLLIWCVNYFGIFLPAR
jgi:hypothetical protein